MNKREGVAFLFTIAKEIQHSFTSPVILFTRVDYAEEIFTTFKSVRQALLDRSPPEKIVEIVYSFHKTWLDAVLEIEKFKKRVKETPRDAILKSIDYTIDCTRYRYMNISKYMEKWRNAMTVDENQLMQTDLTIIKDMRDIVNNALLEKREYIRSQTDETEYHLRINDEIEELLHWLDSLNDDLAIEFCKVLNFKVPLAPTSLTKTLREIVDEVATNTDPEAQRVAELIHVKGRMLGSSVRLSTTSEIDIAKIIEKIRALENRICRLQAQKSSALLALKHKTMFLEERLQSLENIKLSLKRLSIVSEDETGGENLQERRHKRIFNHLLPHNDRCRLVEKLMELWSSAMIEHDHDSIISILSVANLKEVFSDEEGFFSVDKFGRKIYTKPNDDLLYQLDEHGVLVPLKDDEEHVYFYDSCGRYYINETRQRVYKNHDGASEYMLSKCGYLVKVLERKDGYDYYYDWLGRYYIDEDGRQIYNEENSTEEYEHDGLGNLVKIHKATFIYKQCELNEPMTVKENFYLKEEVGDALRKCIAEVIVHQPTDPIADLADRLTKYSNDIKARQKHMKEEQDRLEKSKLIPIPKGTKESYVSSSFTDYESRDYNFINYEHDAVGALAASL